MSNSGACSLWFRLLPCVCCMPKRLYCNIGKGWRIILMLWRSLAFRWHSYFSFPPQILQYDMWDVTPTELWDWVGLKEKIARWPSWIPTPCLVTDSLRASFSLVGTAWGTACFWLPCQRPPLHRSWATMSPLNHTPATFTLGESSPGTSRSCEKYMNICILHGNLLILVKIILHIWILQLDCGCGEWWSFLGGEPLFQGVLYSGNIRELLILCSTVGK